jgi:hypothetical protein
MSLKLPPQFVNLSVYDVFNLELPDAVYRTLAVLHGLAWQTRGERTPPTTVLELAALRGLQERQMYNHLRKLKELGRIRVDNLGHGQIVIYPVRWERGATLPLAEQSTLTGAELACLAGEEEVQLEPDERPPAGESTAKNCSNMFKQHVVVDSVLHHDIDSEYEQQHVTAKNCSRPEVMQAIADIFVEDGDLPEIAQPKAANLIEKYGLERCQRQLSHFPRRCELTRASEEGLRNPSGLFIRSVQRNWARPAQPQKKPPKCWYTEGEFENFIQH